MEKSEQVQKQQLYLKLADLVKNDKECLAERNKKQQILDNLPNSLWQFMKSRKINIEQALAEVPRFIRLKNSPELKNQKEQVDQILMRDLNADPKQIVKVTSSCFALSPSLKINRSGLYQSGKIYGMDISSMMAIDCLDIDQSCHELLELCSAPGNKSMCACDKFPMLKVTGVQINQNRANVMKSLIFKYKLADRINVMVEDATTFKSGQTELYDRVLVDAQCTHQGSIKHLKKFASQSNDKSKKTKKEKKKCKNMQKQIEKQHMINNNPYMSLHSKKNNWQMEDFEQRFLDPLKLEKLSDLQYNLAQNGFSLLKEGGIMVYSTCSADQNQNQQIVQKLISSNQNAHLLDATKSLKYCPLNFRSGAIEQTVYFTPKLSMCGGMFIAKIGKISPEISQIKKKSQANNEISKKLEIV